MQRIERDGYTREEIIRALHSPYRQLRFKYLLLDNKDNLKKELNTVESCRVDYKSLASIKSKINMTLRNDNDIDYLKDRIKPIVQLKMPEGYISFTQGIYLFNSPIREDITGQEYRTLDGFDKLQILEDDKVESYYIAIGSNYIEEIKKLIQSTGEIKINISLSEKNIQTEKEWFAVSKLNIINELLKELNYYSLRVDEEGYFVSEPFVLPENKSIEYEYITDSKSVIYNGLSEELDMWEVHNVVIATLSNPELPTMTAIAENHNPLSPTSIENLGRRKVKIEEVDSIADQEALNEYSNRSLSNESQIYGKIVFKTAIMPAHGYLDSLKVRYDNLKIDDEFQETAWSINMQIGGEMTHECRKVVSV